MEEDSKLDVSTGLEAAARARLEKRHFQRELRGKELQAYSGVLEALRASGKPSTEKDGIIKTLRDFFNISEDRHKAEIRLLAYDEKLALISQKLTGYNFTEEWAFQAQKIYVPLGQQPFSIFRSYPTSFTRGCITIRDPTPLQKDKYNDDSDVHSEAELDVIENIIKDNPVCNGWAPEKQRPLTVAVDLGTGNEEEIEEIDQHIKKRLKLNKKHQSFTPAKSPDITETPRVPNKFANLKNENKPSGVSKGRGVKRKESEEFMIPPMENIIPTAPPSKVSDQPKSRHKISRSNRASTNKMKVSRRPIIPSVELKKAKESSEETSSADEGENGPLPLEESSRVMSPVFSEVIRSSVLSRGRGPRGRVGVDRRKNNAVSSPSKPKAGKARPKTPNQKSGKFKNSVPTSGSRRKSKLNEKLDYDDVLMDLDGNEMEKQAVYSVNTDDVSRRLLLDSQSFDRIGDSRVSYKEFKSSEDCAIYAESLPINYNHEDMEQVNDGVFKRPLPPSRGPKLWEIKDARLTHRDDSISDENNSNNFNYCEIDASHQQHTSPENAVTQTHSANDIVGSSSPVKHELPPPSKKQRIKSPLIVNPNINPPNISKVPLPAPVFSTSLSSVNKKRQNSKPISVVDSLNLHLPTSATASSLAASSNNRRPGTATGGGCSMFSNSTALIAGARGTAPGILQQQRKAQPHILANSKVHRAFIPSMNVGSSVSNSVTSNTLPPLSATPTFTTATVAHNSPVVAGSASSHTVQISPSSPIPISAISTVPSSPTPVPYQNFPSSNSPSINLTNPTGVPIDHVNRSPPGTNIIFVQKSNGPAVPPVPANVISLKTSPRAVILRRTQLPRQVQGNVMILDVQKNQIVTPGQGSPFLQTARILNAPGELSLLNIQPSSSPRKSSPTSTIGSSSLTPSDTSPVQTQMSPPQFQKPDGVVLQAANPESFITNLSENINHQPVVSSSILYPDKENTQANDTNQAEEVPQDAEYAQIEAELMQMEQGSFEDVVYEEEVTTEIVPLEDGENTQFIYTNDTCASTEGENATPCQEVSAHDSSTISGSSTDTSSENETSAHQLELPDVDSSSRQTLIKKVSLSPGEEIKMASDAISRALSLSKSSPSSPSKRLTFSVPITLGTASSGEKSNAVSDSVIVPINASDIDAVPAPFQTSSTEVTSPVVVQEGDSSSTNSVDVANSNAASTIDVAVRSNEGLQHSQSHAQERANTS